MTARAAGSSLMTESLSVAAQGRLAMPSHSSDYLNLHAKVVCPLLPKSIGSESRAGEAAGKCQAHSVRQAETRAMAVEGRRQAGIESAKRADRDAEGVHVAVDRLDRY